MVLKALLDNDMNLDVDQKVDAFKLYSQYRDEIAKVIHKPS